MSDNIHTNQKPSSYGKQVYRDRPTVKKQQLEQLKKLRLPINDIKVVT